MPRPRPLRPVVEWDGRFTRMCGVSAVAHVLVVLGIALLSTSAGYRPPPLVAYTVELTDPNALGGRLPPGAPGKNLAGGAVAEPAAVPPGPPPAPPQPEPKAPEVKLPEPKPEPPKPEAKAEPKPEPKPAPKPEPKPEPKAEPKPEPKAEAKKPESPAKPEPAKETKPATKQVVQPDRPAGPQEATGGGADTTPHDAYAAAAERWRSRAAGTGGGLGGEGGSGPIGAGGEGPGGGGQVVGLEFLAYRQQVINTVKGRWTNVIARPGLVAIVRFAIDSDGAVSEVQLAKSSGNAAYDGSALRAVQISNPLPPPPAKYAREFREFLIEFHSEEHGGQEAG